jgi:hypothetical protein
MISESWQLKMFPVEIQLFIDAFCHFGDLRRHYLQYLL